MAISSFYAAVTWRKISGILHALIFHETWKTCFWTHFVSLLAQKSKQIFPHKIIQVSFKSSHYCSFMQKNPAKFHALIFDRIPNYIPDNKKKVLPEFSRFFLNFLKDKHCLTFQQHYYKTTINVQNSHLWVNHCGWLNKHKLGM